MNLINKKHTTIATNINYNMIECNFRTFSKTLLTYFKSHEREFWPLMKIRSEQKYGRIIWRRFRSSVKSRNNRLNTTPNRRISHQHSVSAYI